MGNYILDAIAAAHAWFVEARWGKTGRFCPRCGSADTAVSKRQNYFWCPDCKERFTVRTGSAIERSKVPLRKWVLAIYLLSTNLKGVSSMKLHRDLGITQKTAWFMLHRLREAWTGEPSGSFAGPVEVDETFMGGRDRNKHANKKPRVGRGPVSKTAVVGAKDRETNRVSAAVITDALNAKTLHGFVHHHAALGATVYTDDAAAYRGMRGIEHEAVKHSVGEYVRDMAHTNGIESFWSMLKRGYHGTYHQMSAKHLQRYVNEFSGRHNVRDQDTIDQMSGVVAGMVGRRLMYRDLAKTKQIPTGQVHDPLRHEIPV